MNPSIKTLLTAGAAIGMIALSPLASAQNYPSKPVTMIVAFPAGGGSDVIGRLVGRSMADALGQPALSKT